MLYGYARVSSEGQTIESQCDELTTAGCGKIFSEKVSGARTDRVALRKLLSLIANGDSVLVTRLDRLARSTRDLLNILHQVSEKGAKFRSLKEAWCDTSTPTGELLTTILAGFAQFERHLILARTSEGRIRAKRNGVKFGPPFKLNPHQRQEAIRRLETGETLISIARTFGVSSVTIGRLRNGVI
jgi:DNA invertase Pin-like site-specific DNA recombinase